MIYKKLSQYLLSSVGVDVVLTAPLASAQFVVGGVHTISWTVSDVVVAWRPYYSATGGAPYTAILGWQIEDSPDTYDWTVADAPSTTCRIMIAVEDANSAISFGTSAVFTISATDTEVPSGTVTAPG